MRDGLKPQGERLTQRDREKGEGGASHVVGRGGGMKSCGCRGHCAPAPGQCPASCDEPPVQGQNVDSPHTAGVARAGFQPPFLEVRALHLVSGSLGPQWIPQIGSLALSPLQGLLPILGATSGP